LESFTSPITIATLCVAAEALIQNRNAALDHARIEAANLSAGFEEQIGERSNSIKGAMEF